MYITGRPFSRLLLLAAAALSFSLAPCVADAAPRKPVAASARLAKARAKADKATESARKAITRADAAIERCEQSLVELCQLQHGVTGGACEDAALATEFAACHATASGAKRSWQGKSRAIPAAKRAEYESCLDEVGTDDEDTAAERCAGELE
jgi:hypothetical protein